MKLVGLSVFVVIFLVLPVLALKTFVMPALNELKNFYQNSDSISQQIAHN